jgi:type VII secretion protein EccB
MPAQQQNRKDILQAYRLMQERTALALMVGEPDSPNQPLRRRNTATATALIVGAIVAMLFALLGLIGKGGSAQALTNPNTLSLDTDTSTYYVSCTLSNKKAGLCPALNYASALLALDGQANSDGGPPSPTKISQSELSKYAIGPAIGISGLPDPPTSANLEGYKYPWAVCTENDQTTLVGGQPVTGSTPVSAKQNQATLVTAPGSNNTSNSQSTPDWLLYNGARLNVYKYTLTSLLSQGVTPASVPATWLDALPQGPDYKAPFIANLGHASTAPPGTSGSAVTGQLYETSQNGPYFVLDSTGKLDPINAVQESLISDETGKSAAQIQQASVDPDLGPTVPAPKGLPTAQVPRITSLSSNGSVPGSSGNPLCVTYGQGVTAQFTIGGTVPQGSPTTGGGAVVNQVAIPSGYGALVGVAPVAASTGQAKPTATTWCLLVDATRYALPTENTETVLGYQRSNEITLPASVADLVPAGPGLNPAQVTRQVAGPNASATQAAG